MKKAESKEEQKESYNFFLFIAVLTVLSVFMLIQSVSAVSITDYTDLSTNTTVHIKTDMDLSQNYTVLFDNEQLEYKPTYDIIKTGLQPNTEHSILIVSDFGYIQEITTNTKADEEKPFYLAYGIIGLFIMSLVFVVLGYLIPYLELIALPIELIGFIQAIKNESAFVALLFVILFAVSCLMFGKYGKNVIR